MPLPAVRAEEIGDRGDIERIGHRRNGTRAQCCCETRLGLANPARDDGAESAVGGERGRDRGCGQSGTLLGGEPDELPQRGGHLADRQCTKGVRGERDRSLAYRLG